MRGACTAPTRRACATRPATTRHGGPRKPPHASASDAPAVPFSDLQPWDAVEFSTAAADGATTTTTTPTTVLARVLAVQGAGADATITLQPLVRLPDPAAVDGSAAAAWTADEAVPSITVRPSAILRARADLEYGQRANPDRVEDPHGEHAIEVWLEWA
jgi:hypothetical protein